MDIRFIAQSGFIITSSNIRFSIDLWLSNPKCKLEIEDVDKLDYVFITHDHGDHGLVDGIKLAKRDNATFISNYDIMQEVASDHPDVKTDSGNIGGFYKSGELEIMHTHAQHSSSVGEAIGFIIKHNDTTIYHMGDTGYFGALAAMGDMYDIDVLMVPIGSRYTMGPMEAARAVKDLNPKVAIPIHYNTFDKITQDASQFAKLCEGVDVKVLEPRDSFTFSK